MIIIRLDADWPSLTLSQPLILGWLYSHEKKDIDTVSHILHDVHCSDRIIFLWLLAI